MAIPPNYNSWVHLRRVIRQTQNDLVRREFRDLDGIEDSIDTPRTSLRQACLIGGNDSAKIIQLKLFLFYVILRKAKDLHPPIYAVPEKKAVLRRNRPQVKLYFLEDLVDIEFGVPPVEGEISFRLMSETNDTLTRSKIEQLAIKIKNTFGSGNRYVWRKGKNMFSYSDWPLGYQLQLLVRDRTDGRDLAEKVLSLQNHTPDWSKANYAQNEDPLSAYPYNPGTEVVLGETKKKYRRRPNVDVRFTAAFLFLAEHPNPVVLYDSQLLYKNPVVRS